MSHRTASGQSRSRPTRCGTAGSVVTMASQRPQLAADPVPARLVYKGELADWDTRHATALGAPRIRKLGTASPLLLSRLDTPSPLVTPCPWGRAHYPRYVADTDLLLVLLIAARSPCLFPPQHATSLRVLPRPPAIEELEARWCKDMTSTAWSVRTGLTRHPRLCRHAPVHSCPAPHGFVRYGVIIGLLNLL